MKKYCTRIALMLLSLFLLNNVSVSAAILSQVRLGVQNESTVRVVAHLDKKMPCNIFTLKNPSRVVLDFDDTQSTSDLKKQEVQNVSFVKEMRVGQPLPSKSRVVLETLALPTINKGFHLAPSATEKDWRFVVDLELKKNQMKSLQKSVLLPLSNKKATKKITLKKPLIVLDPGHGGTDPGAIARSGRYEKNLTLKMAKETKKALEATGKYRVLLTRETDKAVPLRARTRFAHKHKADLFISIHADSARNRKARGLSVYTISERASDREAQLLAERENKVDILLGMDLSDELPEVSNILIDLAKRDTMDKSAHYANLLVKKMANNVKLVPNAHRFAGFVVLKSPSIPSVLIELGYLSNVQEEKLLQNKSYRAKLTRSIVQAINQYFATVYE